jgi:flagellar basal body-associated protein FliL
MRFSKKGIAAAAGTISFLYAGTTSAQQSNTTAAVVPNAYIVEVDSVNVNVRNLLYSSVNIR